MSPTDVALLQRELHRVSDQVMELSKQVRDYSERVHQVEAADHGRMIAEDEISDFKASVRRWILGSVAAAGTIISIVITVLDRLNA